MGFGLFEGYFLLFKGWMSLFGIGTFDAFDGFVIDGD